MPGPPWLVLPTYNEAENLETVVARRARRARRRRARRLPDPRGGRQLAGRDRGDRRPPRRGPSGRGRGAAPDRARGPRAPRTSPGSGAPSTAARASCSRWTPTSRTIRPTSHGCSTRSRAGAGLALGSRYVPGGGIADWGRVRRAISRGGSWYARRVLGVGVRDLTGGFKCFRAEALAALDLATVRSHGYAFQVELTYRALCAGVEVVEVPIVFRDRLRGESKMSWRIALEAAWLVPAIRRARAARCARPADRLKLRPPRAEAMSDEPSRSRPRPGLLWARRRSCAVAAAVPLVACGPSGASADTARAAVHWSRATRRRSRDSRRSAAASWSSSRRIGRPPGRFSRAIRSAPRACSLRLDRRSAGRAARRSPSRPRAPRRTLAPASLGAGFVAAASVPPAFAARGTAATRPHPRRAIFLPLRRADHIAVRATARVDELLLRRCDRRGSPAGAGGRRSRAADACNTCANRGTTLCIVPGRSPSRRRRTTQETTWQATSPT